MSTTLANALIALSKDLGDYWAGTTTASGNASGLTLIDSALMAKANDWVGPQYQTYVFITEEPAATGATSLYAERAVSSLDNASGTLTTLAFAEQIGSGIDYEVHRLFTPSEKRRALVEACKRGFPYIHEKLVDESQTFGNWLKDGDVESWSSSSALNYWTATTLTLTRESTIKRRGAYSAKLDTAAGNLAQSTTNNADLWNLAGQHVKFRAKVRASEASAVRLAIADGTTTTYSSYHPGGSVWSDEDGYGGLGYWLEVEATIDNNPSSVSFQVVTATATVTAYVDDLQVIGPRYDKVFIGDVGFHQDRALQVSQVYAADVYHYPWQSLPGCWADDAGYLHIPNGIIGYNLRIEGIGVLDFLASGVASTAWTATVNIDSPQTDILTAEAAAYLCNQMVLPNFGRADTTLWKEALAYWQQEIAVRRAKFGMPLPPISSWVGF